MPKLALASIAGLGGVVGIGGGIYLFNKNSKSTDTTSSIKRTIKSRLQGEKFTLLNLNGDGDHWKTLKDEYNKVLSQDSKVFTTSNSNIDEEGLKNLCKSSLEKDEDDSTYSKAKRWCVVPVTVSDYLKNWNLTALPTGPETESQDKEGKWTALSQTYGSSNNKINGVPTLNPPEWQTLQGECKKLEVKKNYEDDFDSSFESSKVWCVEK